MGLNAPREDYLETVTLQTIKKLIGINPIILSSSWDDSLGIIALKLVKKY